MFGYIDNKKPSALFSMIGYLLASMAYGMEFIGKIWLILIDRVCNLLGGSYAWILDGMASSAPFNMLFIFLFIARSFVTNFVVTVLMHQTFRDARFKNPMTIFPLYDLNYAPYNWFITKQYLQPVVYPNIACEHFANSILWWMLFINFFAFAMVFF